MLPLESPHWAELTTFFGQPDELPALLSKWLTAIGTEEEYLAYSRDFFDTFLHQATITNAAFAVAPWLVNVCSDRKTKHRAEYLADVALVEANRLEHGVYYNRAHTEKYPDWLMRDYHNAIQKAQGLVLPTLDECVDPDARQYLIWMKPALFGDAKLAWKQWLEEPELPSR